MKPWFYLLLVLAACDSSDLEPGQTSSAASGSRPARATRRAQDNGGRLDTIETSQRRIDGGQRESMERAGSAEVKAATPPSAGGARAPQRQAAPESKADAGEVRAASEQRTDAEDAGPLPQDGGAAGAAGASGAAGDAMSTVTMSGEAGASGVAGSVGSAGTAGFPSVPVMNTGSCCEASDKPGCGTPETQACVCALQPRCCMAAWDETCTFIVAQKFCQAGVRECVCGGGTGQWQQSECCAQSWTDTCDSVALNKCNARAGCF